LGIAYLFLAEQYIQFNTWKALTSDTFGQVSSKYTKLSYKICMLYWYFLWFYIVLHVDQQISFIVFLWNCI